jgi:hypothetical protein
LEIRGVDDTERCIKFLTTGREDNINVKIDYPFYYGPETAKIQAQKYLEAFYHWIKPMVLELGTGEEVKNLEDFIFGQKQLEFDRKEFYEYLRANNLKADGIYQPYETNDPKNPGTVLNRSGRTREIPLEGRLLGELVAKKGKDINPDEGMGWSRVEIVSSEHEVVRELVGIDSIYEYCTQFVPDSSEPQSYNGEVKTGDLSQADFGEEFRFDKEKNALVPKKEPEPVKKQIDEEKIEMKKIIKKDDQNHFIGMEFGNNSEIERGYHSHSYSSLGDYLATGRSLDIPSTIPRESREPARPDPIIPREHNEPIIPRVPARPEYHIDSINHIESAHEQESRIRDIYRHFDRYDRIINLNENNHIARPATPPEPTNPSEQERTPDERRPGGNE